MQLLQEQLRQQIELHSQTLEQTKEVKTLLFMVRSILINFISF